MSQQGHSNQYPPANHGSHDQAAANMSYPVAGQPIPSNQPYGGYDQSPSQVADPSGNPYATPSNFQYASTGAATHSGSYGNPAGAYQDPAPYQPNPPYPTQQPPPHMTAPAGNGPPHHHIMQETDEELTEDERIEYEKGLITWEKAKSWRFWIRKEWTWIYVVLILLIVLVALVAFFHSQVSLKSFNHVLDMLFRSGSRADNQLAHTCCSEATAVERRVSYTGCGIICPEFPPAVR